MAVTSAAAYEVRPINDLFWPHDYIRPVVSLTVIQIVAFR